MGFLRCIPSVFVIGNEYEILILTERCGRICVTVGNEKERGQKKDGTGVPSFFVWGGTDQKLST